MAEKFLSFFFLIVYHWIIIENYSKILPPIDSSFKKDEESIEIGEFDGVLGNFFTSWKSAHKTVSAWKKNIVGWNFQSLSTKIIFQSQSNSNNLDSNL